MGCWLDTFPNMLQKCNDRSVLDAGIIRQPTFASSGGASDHRYFSTNGFPFTSNHPRGYAAPMSEFADYVDHGASLVTPRVVENVLRQLPLWKVEFTQINAPKFPHLVDQLEFLADAVEDYAEGAYKDLPYYAVAQALFALTYAHKKVDVIPDLIPNLGRADDSSVVRAVLIKNERAFAKYAEAMGFSWSKITSKA